MTSRDDDLHIPTRAELAHEPPVSTVLPPWDGVVPDHAAGWTCCGAPTSVHLSAADLDRADRAREGL